MNLQEKHEPVLSVRNGQDVIENLLRAIAEQFDIVMGNPARVQEICARLKSALTVQTPPEITHHLSTLLPLLTKKTGAMAAPVFELLEEFVGESETPWELLKGMLSAADADLSLRALKRIVQFFSGNDLLLDEEKIRWIAEWTDDPDRAMNGGEHLSCMEALLVSAYPALSDPASELFCSSRNPYLRRLAARILDARNEPLRTEHAERILGKETLSLLAPYLAFVGTHHLELLSLLPFQGQAPPFLNSFRSAMDILGENLLKQVVAELGWQRLNLGIEVRRCVRFSIGDTVPLILRPSEADLLASCGPSPPTSEVFAVITHGTEPESEIVVNNAVDPATQFRLYNLAHAELLARFLAVEPLSVEKVQSMLEQMDRVVRDFVDLFSDFSEECGVLPDIYDRLRSRITEGLQNSPDHAPLSAELTRLVMMFEDPKSVRDTQTLHGLKRYLHQKGLQLGFRLVLRSRSTNRTVDILLATKERLMPAPFKSIRYADFEPDPVKDLSEIRIPYPIAVVAEGFLRQLLYGHESFPRVDVFCYGNEVHYYLSFRNHPAFLRINFAPPLQGGMIDLEYFGVSKYELSVHPDLFLDALRKFFQYLEFDIDIENTRVHARYDKEHAHDLESLCHKVEGIFRLAPYLLDIDWTIGSLQLDADARKKVAEAWAASFAHWGILPLRHVLTEDRTGIVESLEETPAGKREIRWSGDSPYTDRMILRPDDTFYDNLCEAIERLGIGITPARTEEGHRRFGQIRIERWLLYPLRGAVSRGEVLETSEGFRRVPGDLFSRVHEAEFVAHILAGDDAILLQTLSLARCIEPLEKTLDWRTTGFIAGHAVQFSRLPLRGEELGIYILRGDKNRIRLAFFTHGTVLFRHRKDTSDAWRFNALFDSREFVTILRKTNYPVNSSDVLPEVTANDAGLVRIEMMGYIDSPEQKPLAGENIISGLGASPGRAVGRVLFEITGKRPEDLDGHILLASAIRPEDNAFLYHAAGIISTGGGILSHAGLLANQFHKPAIIISGRWEPQRNAAPLLRYTSMEYDVEEKEISGFRISMRKGIKEREHLMTEGDLLIIESAEGRVRVLGQELDALALHESLMQFSRSSAMLSRSTADHDTLILRGRRLQARHQIEKILSRLTNPALACHAVYELLLSRDIPNRIVPVSEKARLFGLIMENPSIGPIALEYLRKIVIEIHQRFAGRLKKALGHIPESYSIHEILNLRLDVLQTGQALGEVKISLQAFGRPDFLFDVLDTTELDRVAKERIRALFKQTLALLHANARTRHVLRDAERMIRIINVPSEEQDIIRSKLLDITQKDTETLGRFSEQNIIRPEDGGIELHPWIGWKAANLCEIGKLTDSRWVPPWFAVSDHAFRSIMQAPMETLVGKTAVYPHKCSTLEEAITSILSAPQTDHAQKAVSIQNLWDAVILPEEFSNEVVSAYHALGTEDNEPYVAIRSSSREEDAEAASRAGEFETFLYIKGDGAVLSYLKRTWSGLWSERAIHNRLVLGHSATVTGGGVIVQRIVHSRISGVIQTVNVGRNDMREIIINAGLGLGEGIVSGTVSADQITVSKGPDPNKEHLQFTYVTADKKEYVVFNKHTGLGTIRCSAPYHKRLRPALEYVELCELVSKALELEMSYGYPLDIEFGLEGTNIWILQVRPIPSFLTAVQETIQKYPLTGGPSVAVTFEGEDCHDQT